MISLYGRRCQTTYYGRMIQVQQSPSIWKSFEKINQSQPCSCSSQKSSSNHDVMVSALVNQTMVNTRMGKIQQRQTKQTNVETAQPAQQTIGWLVLLAADADADAVIVVCCGCAGPVTIATEDDGGCGEPVTTAKDDDGGCGGPVTTATDP